MADQKPFHGEVTLWPKDEYNGPIITRLFNDEGSYYQYIEDNWHNPNYLVDYGGNHHLFKQRKDELENKQ